MQPMTFRHLAFAALIIDRSLAEYPDDGVPLAMAHLPLSGRLTVLYGLNGSGKSFILEALASVLSGQVSERVAGAGVAGLVSAPRNEGGAVSLRALESAWSLA